MNPTPDDRVRLRALLVCLAISLADKGLSALALAVVLRRARISLRDLAPSLPSRADLLYALALGVSLFVSSYALIWVEYAPRSWLFPEHTSHWLAEYVEYKPGSSWAAVIAGALLVTAISPIWEEILYRALLLPKAVSRWGAAPGLLLLSTISAVLHHAMLGPFVFAAVLGILFLSTRSIAVPIIVHSVYNTLAFLTAGFDPWVHPLEGGGAVFDQALIPIVIVSGILALILIAWLIAPHARVVLQRSS